MDCDLFGDLVIIFSSPGRILHYLIMHVTFTPLWEWITAYLMLGRTKMRAPLSIEGFHVTSYQANFASHHTRDRHVGFLLAWNG